MTSLFYCQTNLIDLSEVLEHSLFALPCPPPEQLPHQLGQSWLLTPPGTTFSWFAFLCSHKSYRQTELNALSKFSRPL